MVWPESGTVAVYQGSGPAVRDPGLMRSGGPVTITALPAVVNLELYAGDDFAMMIEVTEPHDVDLTGSEPIAQIRAAPDAADVLGEFSCTIEEVNTVLLDLDRAVTALLPDRAVWDVEVLVDGRATTLAAGVIIMTPQVTRREP